MKGHICVIDSRYIPQTVVLICLKHPATEVPTYANGKWLGYPCSILTAKPDIGSFLWKKQPTHIYIPMKRPQSQGSAFEPTWKRETCPSKNEHQKGPGMTWMVEAVLFLASEPATKMTPQPGHSSQRKDVCWVGHRRTCSSCCFCLSSGDNPSRASLDRSLASRSKMETTLSKAKSNRAFHSLDCHLESLQFLSLKFEKTSMRSSLEEIPSTLGFCLVPWNFSAPVPRICTPAMVLVVFPAEMPWFS